MRWTVCKKCSAVLKEEEVEAPTAKSVEDYRGGRSLEDYPPFHPDPSARRDRVVGVSPVTMVVTLPRRGGSRSRHHDMFSVVL